MGDHFTTVKKLAPSIPHPNAPNEPPGNVLLAPITAFMDRLKQAVSGEPKIMTTPQHA